MITSTLELETVVNKALENDSVAIDTEFTWERTYYPKLGLIQLALSNDDCHLIDPLAIDDLSSLGALLASPDVVKILHDAPQDLAILERATDRTPVNIFDTKVAAGFCGLSCNLSLTNLIEELLEITIPKSETRTNWQQRPLSKKQVEYALDDVRYLRACRVILLTRVYSPEVQTFLDEEQNSFLNATAYQALPDNIRYTKVKGAGNLNRNELAVLRELADWREKVARQTDKPRGHIVPDPILIDTAKNTIIKTDDIAEKTNISPKAYKRYQKELLACVQKGMQCTKDDLPESLRSPRLSEKNREDIEKLAKMIKLKSDTKGIDHNIIGNMADMKFFIKNLSSPDKLKQSKYSTGWRHKFLSEFLF